MTNKGGNTTAFVPGFSDPGDGAFFCGQFKEVVRFGGRDVAAVSSF
ncbi:hypothetical protein [Loigolactobacillus jiayinensis]|uniref:Uncharacterized protein n=1 Tax=Loigolactobacillus jiayinensis TaxID=2486016 RepID=A0ABW1RC23_9LACO|nr:hypothetical protein [Loigolactobacillus jiayinensis]